MVYYLSLLQRISPRTNPEGFSYLSYILGSENRDVPKATFWKDTKKT